VRSNKAGAAGYKYVHRVWFGLANVSRNALQQPLCKRLQCPLILRNILPYPLPLTPFPSHLFNSALSNTSYISFTK
jgi:hypothetical protein